jgi:hypothetical protein
MILNSQPAMIEALRDAGYYELADEFVGKYPGMVEVVSAEMQGLGFPKAVYSTADKTTFAQMASADLEQFEFIGESAMSELRFGLFSQSVSNQPFSAMVDSVKAATVGLDAKGSPLANHAYTHANTAVLSFGGEVSIKNAQALGVKEFEVVGPLDDKTREVCQHALADPIRTEEEWQAADYWGGSPGGWNCRHHLRAAPLTDEEIERLAEEAAEYDG